MSLLDVRLSDRYDLKKDQVLLNGTQALVRLMLMQKARDRAAGHNTAGYVTGYRGSPLGAVDMQMTRARDVLTAQDIRFDPGLNEDLAATAIWGTQQAALRGEGRFDGVFGLWYGKGPGVDRSGDAMRHANMAGTAPLGGVLMACGDDHTSESSTTCHQSDWALVDAHMPVLNPAGVQEILDYGLYGLALSRFAGVWSGLKLMKDTVEVTAVVDGRADRMQFVTPEIDLPPGGLHIRLGDHWIPQEERLVCHKRPAAEAFARANKIDRRMQGRAGARIGLVAAGKNWLDLVHAMGALGLDAKACEALGITTYKVGQTWPLDMASLRDWAEGLDVIVCIEEKRKLIEVQVKEAIFDDRRGRQVYGALGPNGAALFPSHFALDPADVAETLGKLLQELGVESPPIQAGLSKLQAARTQEIAPDLATRSPYFCSGCPHNTSTKVPDGARAGAGIGCHVMALWMDRGTEGYTHMGAEGANWIGEAPFSTRKHVFQNLGEGTYNHSGLMAIRAARAAGTNITYKILYNDAVAMTGGQSNDGDLPPEQVAREVLAAGVKTVVVVYDPKEEVDKTRFPAGLEWHTRDHLGAVQTRLQSVEGVSVLLFIQTCAAEKRRRRKRGSFPDLEKRMFINTDVCEGCGDCSIQSNCVSIIPVETPFGTKRAIEQSSCNKDYSCADGFCPSFVTVEGGTPRKAAITHVVVPDLPEPELPTIDGTFNVLATGVGGTGVVTLGAVLAMAAHLDGKGAAMMEMAGLAQKGGAVTVHCRLANTPSDISAIRVAIGECDTLIGGDLVVSAGAKTQTLLDPARTHAVVNTHETTTSAFTLNRDYSLPGDGLRAALSERLGSRLMSIDASELSKVLMGDSIYANMMLLGAAWQAGRLPVSLAALTQAITLNGAAVDRNKQAFTYGRWAAFDPQSIADLLAPTEPAKKDPEAARIAHLKEYQGQRLEKRYLRLLELAPDAQVHDAMAASFHKLLTYKDEYEVARLLRGTKAQAEAAFDGPMTLTYHLAPSILSRVGPNGRPLKRPFGSWLEKLFPILAFGKHLRGTPFDLFGYAEERRKERALISQYEQDMKRLLPMLTAQNRDLILSLAELPLDIRGFGPVKAAAMETAAQRRAELLTAIDRGPSATMPEAAE